MMRTALYLILFLPALFGVARLARRNEAAVPLVAPCILFLYEGAAMVWAVEGTLTRHVWLVALSAFFIAGLLLIWDFFSMPRWYYLKGLDLRRHRLQYERLAQKIRECLWLNHLPPASAQLNPAGLIGLWQLDAADERRLFELVSELPESETARRRFALLLWASLVLMLIVFLVSYFNHSTSFLPPFL